MLFAELNTWLVMIQDTNLFVRHISEEGRMYLVTLKGFCRSTRKVVKCIN